MSSFFIDTNILLRSVDRASAHHAVSLDVLARLTTGVHEAFISAQVLSEFWSAATRPAEVNGMGMGFGTAERALQQVMAAFPCLPEPKDLAARWWDLIRRHQVISKQAHDARIVAFMLGHGIDTLLTINAKDFARFTEVASVTPEQFLAGQP